MTAHAHSLQAFRSERRSGKLSRRATAVLAWLRAEGPATDREVMAGLGFRDPNAVRPRITELLEDGHLVETAEVICPVTGKRVRRVGLCPPPAAPAPVILRRACRGPAKQLTFSFRSDRSDGSVRSDAPKL